jgi:hypothetical protein
MKLVIRTVFFHLCCIALFTGIYYYLRRDFAVHGAYDVTAMDCVLLSTTIQSSVGISNVVPLTNLTKIVMTIQQLLLITTYVFTVYIFLL